MANNSANAPLPAPPPTRRPLLALGAALLAVLFVAVMPQVTGPGATASASGGSASPASGSPVHVRWLVSLGVTGSAVPQLGPEKAFLEAFNGSRGSIYLDLEVVPSANVSDVLKTDIAAGNPPDIVGPIGARGRNGFGGDFLDLTPMLPAHAVDTSIWEPALMDLLKDETGAQVGLPYLMYPAFMFYNKDIFTKAGLPDPPKKVGQTYMGKTWDWNTVAELGVQLTLDKNGKHPTDTGFDANSIVQFGFDAPSWDARRLASAFGGGSFVASDGKTAQLPTMWADAWKWYYDAMWNKHFAPTAKYMNSVLLNLGSPGTSIASGRIAMAATNTWTINSFGTLGKSNIKAWDMAVMPSWKGQTSGPLDMETFVIPNGSRHPDEALQTILALMADPGLRQGYGGMPAAEADRAHWFADYDKTLAAIYPNNHPTWSVLEEMAAYPAIPSHEADMPNATQAIKDYGDFFTALQSRPGLDVDAELAKLKDRLQADFDQPGLQP